MVGFNINDFKHGDLCPDGRICWVDGDGIARPVSSDLFKQLEGIVQSNRDYVENLNARLKDDRWGVAHEVTGYVAGIGFVTANMTGDELQDYFASLGEASEAVVDRSIARIRGEYGL